MPVRWRWDSGLFNAIIWVRSDDSFVAATYGGLYEGPANFSPQPGGIALLDGATGSQVWRFETPTQAFPAAFIDDEVVFGTGNGTVFALGRASGVERWRIEFDGIPFQVVSAGDVVLVADADPETWGPNGLVDKTRLGGRVWGVDPQTGKVLWKQNVGSFNAFIGTAGSVVVASASTPQVNSETKAFDVHSGAELWSQPYEASSPPAVTTKEVLIPGATMRTFDTATGADLWAATPPNGGTFFFPLVAGDVAVAASNTGTISILDAATGQERGVAQMGDCSARWFEFDDLPYGIVCTGLVRLEPDGSGWKLVVVLIPQGAIDSAAPIGRGVVISTGIGTAPERVLVLEPVP
ncbi:MAG: PQQ-binding-like beta-propeller repeat protein [Dehalococcoidia bacterium]